MVSHQAFRITISSLDEMVSLNLFEKVTITIKEEGGSRLSKHVYAYELVQLILR